jgi:hypothetical protein
MITDRPPGTRIIPCQILCVLVLSAPLKFGTRARAVVISMVIIKAVTGAQPATAAHVAFELMVCSVWCLAGLAT